MEIVRLESISHAYQVGKITFKSFFKRESTQKYVLKDVSRLQTNIVLVFVFFTVFREKWLF
ncbi:hypothetical protein ACTGWD_08845 [Streptococcus suis]